MKKRENQSNSAIMGNGDSARKAKSTKSSEKSNRLKAKLLATYYGHPMKDMKLIAITGTTGKNEVAHFVHEILKSAGQPVAIFAAPGQFKITALYKFLSEAWKAGANYVVVTAPIESLADGVFSELPVHVAALTNYRPMRLSCPDEDEQAYVASTADEVAPEKFFTKPEDYYNATVKIFQNAPDYVVLNHDDATSNKFVDYAGLEGTLFYGLDRTSHIQIMNSKLYKKGVEAMLSIGGTRFTVASFLTGEQAVSYMACAAAVADALHIAPEKIIDGIANFEL